MGSVVAKPHSCQAVEYLQGLCLQWELLLQVMGWKPALDPHPMAGQTLLRAAGSASLGSHHPATMPSIQRPHAATLGAELLKPRCPLGH